MNILKMLFGSRKPALNKPAVSISASPKANPYALVWYRADWSKTKTEKNNAKYWEWEIMYNGFKCP
jgi:hypothetical protein